MHQRVANENKQTTIIKHATNNTKKIKVENPRTKMETLGKKYNAKRLLVSKNP
jgi:hypothetical protein